MSRREPKSRKRNFVRSLEMLEDRVVLEHGTRYRHSPPLEFPSVWPRFGDRASALERVDHGFMAKSKHLKSFVTERTDYLRNVLARVAARREVQVQNVSVAANMGSSASLATHAQSLNDRLDQIVGSFNTQVTQLSNAFEQELGVLTDPLATHSRQQSRIRQPLRPARSAPPAAR